MSRIHATQWIIPAVAALGLTWGYVGRAQDLVVLHKSSSDLLLMSGAHVPRQADNLDNLGKLTRPFEGATPCWHPGLSRR
jgi:hypothetical protein